MQEKIMNQIEEVISDTLVDPGRFLIDMSEQKLKMMLIKGVRKLKRTVLHVQVVFHWPTCSGCYSLAYMFRLFFIGLHVQVVIHWPKCSGCFSLVYMFRLYIIDLRQKLKNILISLQLKF